MFRRQTFGGSWLKLSAHRKAGAWFSRDGHRAAAAEHAERLRILHGIDRAILAGDPPEAIAGRVIQPLRGDGVYRYAVRFLDGTTDTLFAFELQVV